MHQSNSQVPRGHFAHRTDHSLDPRPYALYTPRSFPSDRSPTSPYTSFLPCDLHSSPAICCCYALCLCRQQLPMDPEFNPAPGLLSDPDSRTQLIDSELIPNRYIVEFDTAASLKASNMKRSGTVSHPCFSKDLTNNSLTKSSIVNSRLAESISGSTRNTLPIFLSELLSRSMRIRI